MARQPTARYTAAMRWVVRDRQDATVGDVLERARADANAVDDGRVFVGRRRVRRRDERVCIGDVIEVAPPLAEQAPPIRVLLATPGLVAVEKPAGIPTIADHGGSAHALLVLAARILGASPSTLHPTSRLDRWVSGVVVFARTPAAAQRLSQARREGRYLRRYVALSTRPPSPSNGTWEAPIGRAPDPRLRAAFGREPVPATTRYAAVAQALSGETLLAVAPITGRTHQIRVHAAHAGVPLLGDRMYGGPKRMTLSSGRVLELERIALHAARVVVPDETGAELDLEAPVPPDLRRLWEALGGSATAWEAGTSCALV